jgi:hypothetical protein
MTFEKLLEQIHEGDLKFIEDEQRRIEPQICEGDMQAEVKSNMGKWAKATGVWGSMHYSHIVDAYAEARGWTQEGFDEMEVIEPFWDWVEDRG